MPNIHFHLISLYIHTMWVHWIKVRHRITLCMKWGKQFDMIYSPSIQLAVPFIHWIWFSRTLLPLLHALPLFDAFRRIFLLLCHMNHSCASTGGSAVIVLYSLNFFLALSLATASITLLLLSLFIFTIRFFHDEQVFASLPIISHSLSLPVALHWIWYENVRMNYLLSSYKSFVVWQRWLICLELGTRAFAVMKIAFDSTSDACPISMANRMQRSTYSILPLCNHSAGKMVSQVCMTGTLPSTLDSRLSTLDVRLTTKYTQQSSCVWTATRLRILHLIFIADTVVHNSVIDCCCAFHILFWLWICCVESPCRVQCVHCATTSVTIFCTYQRQTHTHTHSKRKGHCKCRIDGQWILKWIVFSEYDLLHFKAEKTRKFDQGWFRCAIKSLSVHKPNSFQTHHLSSSVPEWESTKKILFFSAQTNRNSVYYVKLTQVS